MREMWIRCSDEIASDTGASTMTGGGAEELYLFLL